MSVLFKRLDTATFGQVSTVAEIEISRSAQGG
jgi:hypothetical protein